MKQQKLFIKTYGCQMNVYDSDRMAGLLKKHGYDLTNNQEEADLIIINTCHIREKAAEKVFSELGRLKAIKDKKQKQGKDLHLAVAGCTAQAEGQEIGRRAPYVDMIFGPQSYHELPEMLERLKRQKEKNKNFPDTQRKNRVVETDFTTLEKFDALKVPHDHNGPTAFLTIQEGCDKFCHFCVVPYTRGAEASRPVKAIIDEAKQLVDKGALEITLLGQNVNAYHGTGPNGQPYNLGRLCYEIAEKVPGLQRLRYTTSHPRDVHEDQITAHRDLDILMPFLHLPVQSGSDAILKAMNRKHTAQWYRDIIQKFRDAQPAIAFSSDFIVGYPGETKEDFLETLRLVNDIDYAQAFSFKYSVRPGTPASFLEDQVSEEEKNERLQMLQQLLNAQQHKFNRSLEKSDQKLLIDRKGREDGSYIGRSPYLQPIHVVSSQNILNQIVKVHINHAGTNSLNGTLM